MSDQKITLTIKGRPYVKKNSRRMIYRGGKRFFVPSKNFTAFEYDAIAQIHEQLGKIPVMPLFQGKIQVSTYFLIKGKFRVDGDNLHTSILDILEAAKVIDDDQNILVGRWYKEMGNRAWSTIIKVSKIEDV